MSEPTTVSADQGLYKQRADLFQLSMALAERLGMKVGSRYDETDVKREWPVLVIYLPAGEVAQHTWHKDVAPATLKLGGAGPWDGHTDEDKSVRIRKFIG